MDRIITLVTDPTFWFATVIVGFLLSILANVASDWLKHIWGHFSASQRAANEREQRWIDREARKCIEYPFYFELLTAETKIGHELAPYSHLQWILVFFVFYTFIRGSQDSFNYAVWWFVLTWILTYMKNFALLSTRKYRKIVRRVRYLVEMEMRTPLQP